MSVTPPKQLNTFKYLAIISLILLGIYTFKVNSDYNELENAFYDEQVALQGELDEIIEDYKDVKVKNKTLSRRLIKEINKIIALRDSVKSLNKTNYASILKYSRKIAKLERENRKLFMQVDSLNKQNYALLQENITVKQELNNNEKNRKLLAVQNEFLEQKVAVAGAIKTSEVKASALKERSSGKLTNTFKSSKTDAFKIKFDLLENQLTKPGAKEIYVQIVDEDKNVVAAKGDATLKDGTKVVYSDNITADYDNGRLGVVSLVLVNRKDINKGNYIVNTFVDGIFVGNDTVALR